MTTLAPKKVTLSVEGMTCAACVGHVEEALHEVSGVQAARVNLATERATVELGGTPIDLDILVHALEDAGYGARVYTTTLLLGDRDPDTTLEKVKEAVKALPGLRSVDIDLAGGKATVEYLASVLEKEEIRQAIEATGWTVLGFEEAEGFDQHALAKETEAILLRKKFLVALTGGGVVMVLSMVYMIPGFQFMPPQLFNILLFLISTPIQFWAGSQFYTGAWSALRHKTSNTSLIFVPGPFATDAILESAEAGVDIIVCITDGIPTLDMVMVQQYLKGRKTRLVGPNCPGLTSPGDKAKVGIIPGNIHRPGGVGVVSRSGTLTYEGTAQLTQRGIGQSTCVGIGGDPIIGMRFVDVLALFEEDPETEAVVLIGEIGGTAEQEAAEFIRTQMTKPVTAFIAGATAPAGRRMGHAGAIITGAQGTAAAKKEALRAAGCYVAETPGEVGATVERMLQENGLAG